MSIQGGFIYPSLYTGGSISEMDNTNCLQNNVTFINENDIAYEGHQLPNDCTEIQPEIDKTVDIGDNNNALETIALQTNYQPDVFNTEIATEPIYQMSQPFPSMQNIQNISPATQMPFQTNNGTCLISYPNTGDDFVVSMNSTMPVFQGLINYQQTPATNLVTVPSEPTIQFVPGMMNFFQPVISDDLSLQGNPHVQVIQGLINYPALNNNELSTQYNPSLQIYSGNIIQQPCPGDFGNCVAIQPVYSDPTIQHIFMN